METLKSKAPLLIVVIILQIQSCIANTAAAEDDCVASGSPICIPANYSKYDHPSLKHPETDQPTNILVDFSCINLLKVNDYDSTVSILLSMTLQWLDPRLEFRLDSVNREFIPLPKTLSDKLWIPDVTIMGVNKLEKHDLMDRKTEENLILVNGTYLAYGREIDITIYCPMNFDLYPTDSQNCSFQLYR